MFMARIEIAKGDVNADFHIRAPALTALVAEVARAAEEAREEVEWVVAATAAATLLVLGEAVVAVLVVDFAGFRVGEGVVGFGYLDEFLGDGVVASMIW